MTGETHLECVAGGDVDLALVDSVQLTVVETHGGELVGQVHEKVIQLETGAHVKAAGNTAHTMTGLKFHVEHILDLCFATVSRGFYNPEHRVVIDIQAQMGNDEKIKIRILVAVQEVHRGFEADILGIGLTQFLFIHVRGILDAKAIAHIERLVTGNGMGIGPGQAEAVEIGPLLNATTGGNIEDRAIRDTHSSHITRKIILGTGGRHRGEQNAQDK